MQEESSLGRLHRQKKYVRWVGYILGAAIFALLLIGDSALPGTTHDILLALIAPFAAGMALWLALKMRALDDEIRVISVKDALEKGLRTRGIGVIREEYDSPLHGKLRGAGWEPDLVVSIGAEKFVIEVKSASGLSSTTATTMLRTLPFPAQYLVVVGEPSRSVVEEVSQTGVEVRAAKDQGDAERLAEEIVAMQAVS